MKDLFSFEIVKLRFTRLPFGCASRPFILSGTLQEHLNLFMTNDAENKTIVEEIQADLYVDYPMAVQNFMLRILRILQSEFLKTEGFTFINGTPMLIL